MRTLVLVVLVACGGGSKPSTAPKPAVTCSGVADAMVGMMIESMEPRPGQETIDGITGIIKTRCDQDAWTADAKQCLATMKTRTDAEHCSTLLTEEQQANLVRDQKAKFGAAPATEAKPEPESAAAPPAEKEKAPEAPKKRLKSPKPGGGGGKTGDPCDGSE